VTRRSPPGATLQANLLRSPASAEALTGASVHVRLFKGANAVPDGAHPDGRPPTLPYLRLAFRLADAGTRWPMATHDGRPREALLLAPGTDDPGRAAARRAP